MNERPTTARPAVGSRRTRPGPGTESASSITAAADRERRFGAKALVTREGRLLLIRERRADGSTFWTLPGGGLEAGESLPACLRREIREELRCGSTVGPALATCRYQHTSKPDTTSFYAVFAAELDTEPEPDPREGVVDWEWRTPDALPPTTLDPFRRLVETSLGGTR